MLYPAQVANNYLQTGKTKASLQAGKMMVLSILAGAFIALAAVGATTASTAFASSAGARIAAALVFPVGLLMVLVAGSELFTGNNLMVIPLYEKQITFASMMRNWGIVYAGNFIGSMLVVLMMQASGQWGSFSGAVAVYAIKTASTKIGYGFIKALCLGIGCNFLVCIAVWLSYAADSVGGKLAALYLPIALFILIGFEHSVANMYYIPAGLLAASNSEWLAQAVSAGVNTSLLTWGGFLLNNLLPVTIGNIIGGSLCVGTPYWYIYVKQAAAKTQKEDKAA